MRRLLLGLAVLLMLAMSTPAQDEDGLNLPTELYILLNAGQVERYGLGAAGVTTITPEDAFVVDFAVAPDGGWMAYRTETGLTLIDMADPAPLQLEGETASFPPVRGQGQTMAWSPDGTALVFTAEYGFRAAFDVASGAPRFAAIAVSPVVHLEWSPGGNFLAVEVEGNVWWVYRLDGEAFTLIAAVPSSVGADWIDEGRLVIAPADGGLFTLDLLNANAQTPLQSADRLYRLPYVRPDGSIVVFTRLLDEPEIAASAGFFQRLTVDGTTATVEETADVDVDLNGLRWAPTGRLMIAFRGGSLALVDPVSAMGFQLPIANAVHYGWGAVRPPGVRGIAMDQTLYFRAPDAFGIAQVWRLPADGSERQQLTEAEFDVTAYATFGETLAYVSGGTLWRLDPGGEAVELAPVNETATDLAFSPDGSALVYATTNVLSGGLWRVATTPGDDLNTPEELLPNSDGTDYRRPIFAPNVNALLVAIEPEDGPRRFALFDLASGDLLPLGTYDAARWLDDGRILAYRTGDGDAGAVLDLIDPMADPVAVSAVYAAPDEIILDAAAIGGTQAAILVRTDLPGGPVPVRLIAVPLAGGAPQETARVGYIDRPQISEDGETIAGTVQPNGGLMVYKVSDRTLTALRQPLAVDQLGFR
jgi:sugar lactone lactonase YvrE